MTPLWLDNRTVGGSTVRGTYTPFEPQTEAIAARYVSDGRRGQVSIEVFDARGAAVAPTWAVLVGARLTELFNLPMGWDGHWGKPLTRPALRSVVQVLATVMGSKDRFVDPRLIPLVDGGVQVEWHAGGDVIDLEIDATGELFAYVATRDGETLLECELARNDAAALAIVSDLLDKVTARVTSVG